MTITIPVITKQRVFPIIYCSHACGEDIEVSDSLTYLGSVVHNSGEWPGSLTTDWSGPRCYGLAQRKYMALLIPVQRDEDPDLQVPCALYLALWV